MSTYLETFRSSVPTVQGRQILNLLQKKKDSGEIRSVEEFKARLTQLTESLLEEEIIPSLKLFLGEAGEVIDSETYNFMLQRINDDLQTAFAEVKTIEEVLAAHNQIVNQVTLKTIQLAINEINERVTLYEFINGSRLGFNKGQFNTFSTTKAASVSRNEDLGKLLYEGLEAGEEALIDTVGERLTLGYEDNFIAPVQGVTHLFDEEVSASEVDVRFKDSRVENIIDGRNDTYWFYNTLLSRPKQDGVVHKLELDLAATQDANFIEIEPAAPHPMILEDITYVRSDLLEFSLGIQPVLIKKPVRINFGKVTAAKLKLKFRQYNYVESQFEEHQIDENFYNVVVNDLDQPVDVAPISDHLREILSSDFQLDGLFGVPRNPAAFPKHKLYQYLIGFDNIRVGFSAYQPRSVYVSSPLSVENPGMVGLNAVETRPQNGLTSPDSTAYFTGSVEYDIIKENFDSNGNFISAERFPVLPTGVVNVLHERLDLTHKVGASLSNNVGILRFYPDLSQSVKIYRNGTLLTGPGPFDEWDYETTLSQDTPSAENRMVRAAKIADVAPSDIYTVSYTPKVGNAQELPSSFSFPLLTTVNLGNGSRIRMIRNNIIITDRQLESNLIASSNIYLIILLRRNTPDETVTPTVEEYMLLASSEDSSKLESGLV